jgi:hypothetical protein
MLDKQNNQAEQEKQNNQTERQQTEQSEECAQADDDRKYSGLFCHLKV